MAYTKNIRKLNQRKHCSRQGALLCPNGEGSINISGHELSEVHVLCVQGRMDFEPVEAEKLTAVKAREEIIFCRDRVAASLNHLGAWQDLQQEAIMERRQRDAKASFEGAKYGFKTLAAVEEWKLQHEPENTFGKTARFSLPREPL